MDVFAAARLAIGSAFLMIAAESDVRTRKIRDQVWIVLGSIALLILCLEVVTPRSGTAALVLRHPEVSALVACTTILFYWNFFGAPMLDKDGFHFRPIQVLALSIAVALFAFPVTSYRVSGRTIPPELLELYSVPVMMAAYLGLYLAGTYGGADAKALITLTALVPTYPDASPFPLLAPSPGPQDALRFTFPFPFVVFTNAAIPLLAVPFWRLVKNVIRGDLSFPQAFLGYRVPVQRIPAKTWLLERINNRGRLSLVLFRQQRLNLSREVEKLRARGINHVWVTPILPLIVPILCGFWLAFFLGISWFGSSGPADEPTGRNPDIAPVPSARQAVV